MPIDVILESAILSNFPIDFDLIMPNTETIKYNKCFYIYNVVTYYCS